MLKKKIVAISALMLLLVTAGCGTKTAPTTAPVSAQNAPKVTLHIFAAGTLSGPFKEVDKAFQAKYPNVTVEPQFGGSVKMVKQVTDLKQQGDVVAVADYNVIPKYMFGKGGKQVYTDWYAGFATNAITFVYTDKSKGHDKINATNWYQVLSEQGTQIGRSNPDTDPSGYQTLQMLNLAESYYKTAGLAEKVLANAPKTNIRDTETELLSALEAGQIDYLAIYKSDAKQHNLKYLNLPPQIDLSDAQYSDAYSQAKVTTKNGQLTASPIVYAVTVPNNTPNAEWAKKYVAFLLGPEGQSIMQKDGFGTLAKPYANDVSKVPQELSSLVTAWPAK